MGILVNSIICSSITVVENFLKQYLPLLPHPLVGHSPPPLGTLLFSAIERILSIAHTPGTDARHMVDTLGSGGGGLVCSQFITVYK